MKETNMFGPHGFSWSSCVGRKSSRAVKLNSGAGPGSTFGPYRRSSCTSLARKMTDDNITLSCHSILYSFYAGGRMCIPSQHLPDVPINSPRYKNFHICCSRYITFGPALLAIRKVFPVFSMHCKPPADAERIKRPRKNPRSNCFRERRK